MIPWLLAFLGAVISVLAFPPFGPGWLIVIGVGLFFLSLTSAESRSRGFWLGGIYGTAFFGGLMWWLSELELIALILIPVQALFFAALGAWLASHARRSGSEWVVLAAGGWALAELIRYHFPVGGLEWGAAGYALSDLLITRIPANMVGTSGLTVLIAILAATLASWVRRGFDPRLLWGPVLALILGVGAFATIGGGAVEGAAVRVAIVQGSTPCPFEHCPPDERLRTYQQHLELTRLIDPGEADLVVWPEGSTGATNADPVLNSGIREAIAAEARRIGAAFLVGGDRTVSHTHWINANVFFNQEGEIVGEYRKQHPVPFGEYVPWRPVFDWIPALDRVPRDMIPGDGPVVFTVDGIEVGSVISYEGGFSRYALAVRRAGADVLVIATNNASYGLTPATDLWVGMTRMRAVELGIPIVHAAVTGRSTFIDSVGSVGRLTGLGTVELLTGGMEIGYRSIYSRLGDLVMYLAALAGFVVWLRSGELVGSDPQNIEEE